MAEDRRHDYRLTGREPSFFTDTLELALAGKPEVIEAGDGPPGREAQRRELYFALFDAETGPFYFDLTIPSEESRIDDAALQFLRFVFSRLIPMDDAARSIPCEHDENEELLGVTIDAAAHWVVFSYSSTLWNTEWEVHFQFADDGSWTCLGIPDWKSPGSYIAS